jgi:hypothetical protein
MNHNRTGERHEQQNRVHLLFFCCDSLFFCRDSLFFCRDSLFFCRDSLFFCCDSLFFCRDSLFFCRDSLFFCRDSLFFCRDSLFFCCELRNENNVSYETLYLEHQTRKKHYTRDVPCCLYAIYNAI